MPDPQIGSVPFQEAIDFYRGKLNIRTRHYDDMLGAIHAKAFTVAGAVKMGLLTDLRTAVDDAITNGTTITDFRKQFDAAIAEHGWTYKGKRGWRTRVIFDTNLRTAHMAGRWQQFQRVKDTRPFLQYQTAGDNRVRPEHAAWDHLVLHIDDAWWDTHMPPNGWGCRCTVRSLSPRQMRRDKLEPGQSPPLEPSERVNTRTGEVYGDVPKGIDTGWNYNVGKAWLGPETAFGQKAIALPPKLRADALGNAAIRTTANRLSKPFSSWVDDVAKQDQTTGEFRVAGYMHNKVIERALARGVNVDDAAIALTDTQLRAMLQQTKAGKLLASADELSRIPALIADPRAILWDKSQRAVIYVLDVGTARSGRYYVMVQFRQPNEITNMIQSAATESAASLKDPDRYEIISGTL